MFIFHGMTDQSFAPYKKRLQKFIFYFVMGFGKTEKSLMLRLYAMHARMVLWASLAADRGIESSFSASFEN